MALFSTLVKSPLFLRTAGGAFAGGVLFHRGAKSRERGSGDVSALATTGTTLLGMAAGAAIGATLPAWKAGTINRYKSIHSGYGGNLSKVVDEAAAKFDKGRAAALKTAMKKGYAAGSDEYRKLLDPFSQRPTVAGAGFGLKAKAAAETYVKPSVVMPAGMVLGAAFAANRGEDPIAGAMTGGLAGAGLGMGYHGFKVYNRFPKFHPARGAMGIGMVGAAYALGSSGNPQEFKEEARAVSTYNGYEAETMQMNFPSGPGRRAMEMGATGDLVFGLQNMRHGY